MAASCELSAAVEDICVTLLRTAGLIVNTFDKICAVVAFPVGVVFLVLGVIGVFAGCSAHFTLPPVLGVIPGFVGWGVVRAVCIAWSGLPPAAAAEDAAKNAPGPT